MEPLKGHWREKKKEVINNGTCDSGSQTLGWKFFSRHSYKFWLQFCSTVFERSLENYSLQKLNFSFTSWLLKTYKDLTCKQFGLVFKEKLNKKTCWLLPLKQQGDKTLVFTCFLQHNTWTRGQSTKHSFLTFNGK